MEFTGTSVNVFIEFTEHLLKLKSKKEYVSVLSFPCAIEKRKYNVLKKHFDAETKNPRAFKGNVEMEWSDYLIDGVFPRLLLKKHGSIKKMLKDKRLWDRPSLFDKSTYHSFFGRMSRPRKSFIKNGKFNNYVELLLYRMNDKNLRTQPMYYFDIERPDWVLNDISKNPNQIKTGRTAVSCVSNFYFRWNSEENKLLLVTVVRHLQWSHLWGDIFGSVYLMKAILDELKVKGDIKVVLLSSTLDEPAKARKILQSYYKEVHDEN